MTGRTRVRRPAVAGQFYPADPGALRSAIDDAFAASVRPPEGAPVPAALVVPHAGFVYSGAIAASAYSRISQAAADIDRVVLLGPSHRVYVRGIAAPSADAFRTPLGDVPIDRAARDLVTALPAVIVDDEPHRNEHSLEVQLPFLQTVLEHFTLLPLAVGDASADEVATVIDSVWGARGTLVVVSTDLSHYLTYQEAAEVDSRTAAAILSRRDGAIGDRDACGARPLRGLLRLAARRDLAVEQLDLRNSGDTAGDHSRVVGYGAFTVG